ncbi:MAG TPA: 2-C-methyl-D-erythritol 4-phosphate cytidylyltransferase [Candidatus Marinimicrobia bacterium]|jgi:2-C-methyl-D-erythritol 4-phosphate cytidylyltransferase|nr:2-C-methyl-D-erythritol 4-phosphate cytidylyltransferase [Candidatus Neomarinimicrobiota bacterium]
MKVSAIIPAAGSGERFGEEKQFKLLSGRPLFFHTLKLFLQSDYIDEIIVAVPSANVDSTHRDVLSMSAGKPVKVVAGGTRRQDSVKNGIDVSDSHSTLVCIHDAARPFVTEDLIQRSISACEFADGAVVGIPSKDTVKFSENGLVKETLDREKIWLAQTPQCFHKNKLLQALYYAETENLTGTDESALMEAMGFSIKLVEGDSNNFKITTKDDWIRAEIVAVRQAQGTVL